MTPDERKIERAILEAFHRLGVPTMGDGNGGAVVAIAKGAHRGRWGFAKACPLMVQVGEPCGHSVESVSVEKLAREIADGLR